MFKFFFRAVALLIAIIVAIPAYALFMTWNSANNPSTRTSADVIVIPGAAQLDGTPGPVLQARLEQSVRLFRAGVAPLIITVGAGAPGDRTTEADSGRRWLINNGVPRSAVVALPKGRDTLTQTKAYVKEMRERKIKIVVIATDPYHCQRSMTMARDLDADPFCAPVPDGPNSLAGSTSRYLIREAGAYLSYITLGRRGIHLSDHLG
ncbi:unannotated protein [freshwater metagenome]|uniref:Unannotated protein n=1 Tax=freshwater metagenome TaxID=449393 RepID=A0A6J6JD99_9ZZZZ|nr:YdcF family protein [Actinomycetota bacterium]